MFSIRPLSVSTRLAHCRNHACLFVPLLAFVVKIVSGGPVMTGPPCQPNEPGRGGMVTEHAPVPNATFVTQVTNNMGQVIGTMPLMTMNVPGGSTASGTVPPVFMGQPACDAINITTLPGAGGTAGGGAGATLRIESIISGHGGFQLANIFTTIALTEGDGVQVRVPDLYADTNHNGAIGGGDLLYSLVDLATYLSSPPTFNFGENFTVVNGQVSGLPDMFFSTTPFTFDPATGFNGTPYNGAAEAMTDHDLESIPEPASIWLLTMGAGATIAMGRKRRQAGK